MTAKISPTYLDNYSDLTQEPSITSRYDWADIDEARWSENYPYQLAILRVNNGAYEVYDSNIYTLPVNPESLVINAPTAILLSPTVGYGVLADHGGMPLRNITISGTTGILPNAGRPTGSQLTGGAAGGLFGGSIAAVQNAVSSATSIVSGPEFYPNLLTDEELPFRATGYYQFHQLQRFIESYAEIKRTEAGTALRMGLLIWKDQAGYLVEPRNFTVTKNTTSPHEYRFNLAMTAWKRINPADLGFTVNASTYSLARARNASFLANLFNTLTAIVNTLRAAKAAILAIRSDFEETIGEALRLASLLIKEVAGIIKTCADFPGHVRDSIAKDLGTFLGVTGSAINSIKNTNFKAAITDALDPEKFNRIRLEAQIAASTNSGAGTSSNNRASTALSQGVTDPEQQRKLEAILQGGGTALVEAINNPANYWLHDAVKPTSFPITPKTKESINSAIQEAQKLTKEDFLEMKEEAKQFLADYADKVGLGSDTYNSTMGFSTAAQIREPIDEDYDVIGALSDTVSLFGKMSAFIEEFRPKTPSVIEYIAASANKAGIDMRVPRSKFAAPFPYGGTLERFALMYLKDATRWHEIAALNNLSAPYVDETGSIYDFLVNGYENEFVIEDGSSLVVGQKIYLSSDTIDRQQRSILEIIKNSEGYWTITVDGDSDLDTFTTSDNAEALIYPQNTVRGGQLLYIPSDLPPTVTSPYSPTSSDVERILNAGDVDGMLTDSGDIAIQLDGDWPLICGVTSIIQWTRTALSTKKGSMLLHPEFGLPIGVGDLTSEYTAKDLLASINQMFKNGPSATKVKSVSVIGEGPTARISMELGIQGVGALLPVDFVAV